LRTILQSKCTRLEDVAFCETPNTHRSASVLEPRHRFPLASSAFPLFLCYETITGSQCNTAIQRDSRAIRALRCEDMERNVFTTNSNQYTQHQQLQTVRGKLPKSTQSHMPAAEGIISSYIATVLQLRPRLKSSRRPTSLRFNQCQRNTLQAYTGYVHVARNDYKQIARRYVFLCKKIHD